MLSIFFSNLSILLSCDVEGTGDVCLRFCDWVTSYADEQLLLSRVDFSDSERLPERIVLASYWICSEGRHSPKDCLKSSVRAADPLIPFAIEGGPNMRERVKTQSSNLHLISR